MATLEEVRLELPLRGGVEIHQVDKGEIHFNSKSKEKMGLESEACYRNGKMFPMDKA